MATDVRDIGQKICNSFDDRPIIARYCRTGAIELHRPIIGNVSPSGDPSKYGAKFPKWRRRLALVFLPPNQGVTSRNLSTSAAYNIIKSCTRAGETCVAARFTAPRRRQPPCFASIQGACGGDPIY